MSNQKTAPRSSLNIAGPLLSASLIISISSLVSRILGLLRDRLLAGTFGLGHDLDMYYASFRIPDFIFNLLILGALSSAFIPIFKNYLSQNKNQAAWNLANNILNILLIITLCICLLVFIFAHQFTSFIAPGFDDMQLATTANLTRIMLVSPIFFTISSITGGILNSFKKFVSYSLAPIMYNLGIIFGILFLVPAFSIYGLAIGVIIGALLNLLIQIPELRATGYRYQLMIQPKNKDMQKILALTIPTMFSLAIAQINLTVDNIIASTLQAGSISAINLATNLFYIPIGIFAIPICTAVFPNLVEHISNNNQQQFGSQLSRSTKQILFVIIPSMIFLYVFRAQIVRILLGTGAFDWEDTTITLNTLGYFALSLPFQALLPLFTRGFYSTQNTTKPLISGAISMVCNIILSLLLAPKLGVSGLALSFAISSVINFLTLNFLLHRHLPKLKFNIFASLIKIIFASISAGLTSYFALHAFEPIFNNMTLVGLFFQTAISSIIGIVVYLSISYLLNIEELFLFFKIFRLSSFTNIFKK
jgi:putative peptidoglycan lipid II flippase